MTFREPKTWRGRVGPTDLNREVRDQLRALRSAVDALEASSGGSGTGILPTGYVMGWAGSTIPIGWLVCDGQLVSKGAYPDLYDIVLATYGSGTATTFVVPDFSSDFLRGVNSPGDGTTGTMGTTGGYSSAGLTLNHSGNMTYFGNSDTAGGSHSHNFNSQHSHNYNHGSNVWSFNDSHGHSFNDHSHAGNTTGSGTTTTGTGNLGTCAGHDHSISGSNANSWGGGHGHSGDIGNVNVTSSTIGQNGATTSSNAAQGDHVHSISHGHDMGHSHVVSDRFPEYDEINWLINWKADPGEDWFIAGEAILGTSMIGA